MGEGDEGLNHGQDFRPASQEVRRSDRRWAFLFLSTLAFLLHRHARARGRAHGQSPQKGHDSEILELTRIPISLCNSHLKCRSSR